MNSPKISTLLNDSDDAFQTPTLKRKVRPAIPSKHPKNAKLSQSLLTVQKKTSEESQTEETFTCPLCKKSFKTTIQGISHLKQCGKKRKIPMSDLQRVLNGNYNAKTSKASSRESIATQNDLSLAAAISLSLAKTTTKPEAAVDKNIYEFQKATLETFGFTSTLSASTSGRRKKSNRVSVLRSRSADDRRKLISEKCAVILLDVDEGSCSSGAENADPNVNQVPKLWAAAGDPAPSASHYVPELRDHIVPSSQLDTVFSSDSDTHQESSTHENSENCMEIMQSTDSECLLEDGPATPLTNSFKIGEYVPSPEVEFI